jgi:hypothetical protein
MLSDPGQTRISAESHQQENDISCNVHRISRELPTYLVMAVWQTTALQE